MSLPRHTALNLLGSLVPLAVSLLVIPAYLDAIGGSRYGVLAMAWLLLGYLGLLDLGIGRATAQHIAVAATSDSSVGDRTFWTSLALALGLGLAGGLIAYPALLILAQYLPDREPGLVLELIDALPWLAACVPLALLQSVLSGALEGRSRFVALNGFAVASNIALQLSPLVAALLVSPRLSVLVAASWTARAIAIAAQAMYCGQIFKSPGTRRFDPQAAKSLVRFGGWVSISAIIGPLMVSLDRLLIGAISGAKAVTLYTIPFQLAERSTALATALVSAAFPSFAACSPDESRTLAVKLFRSLAVATAPAGVAALLLTEPFLTWWLGKEFANSSSHVAQVLILAFFINSLARIPHAQLVAGSRPGIVARLHALELLPYLGLMYWSLSVAGLLGAALAFGARVLVDCLLLCGSTRTLGTALRLNAMPFVFYALSILASHWLVAWQLPWIVASSALLIAVISWSYWMAPASAKAFLQARLTSST